MSKKKPHNPLPLTELRPEPLPYAVWGNGQINAGAHDQMRAAMRLPVSVAGALMPDAHVGYGLPIGGVLATENTVIPYAVGDDIACRMRISLFEATPNLLAQHQGKFERALVEETRFGAGASFAPHERAEHPVMDDPDWEATRQLAALKDKAYAQLGTSGSGNHFVEWGELEILEEDATLGLQAGTYLALLSHSGSRGIGSSIANYYSEIAKSLHNLDKSVAQLGWLSLDSEVGQEYWLSMELAGRFAAATHEIIHRRVAKAAGVKALVSIENHHNFAWKEPYVDETGELREVIVHRKGATPAGVGVLGIIPGSMGDVGYIVRGKGVTSSLNSASHGAGRTMSRRQALSQITKSDQKRYLKESGVKLIGGGLDESPQAYKPIEAVIAAQTDLVDLIGKFTPRIVRMDGDLST
ncbi:MAG: RtcB family protein [Phototrophicaceae bacterium]